MAWVTPTFTPNGANMSVSGGTLTKVAGGGDFNAFAISTEELDSIGDKIQFTGPSLGTELAWIGLSNTPTFDTGAAMFNFNGASVEARVGGLYKSETTFTADAVWEIEIVDVGGAAKAAFKKNGVTFHTSADTITLPVKFDVQFGTQGMAITSAQIDTGTVVDDPPVVGAGADVSGSTGLPIVLSGSVTDEATPTITWSKVSGPGTLTFSNPNDAVTSVTASVAGTYVARLTADDGVNAPVTDDVTITVTDAPAAPSAPTSYNLRSDMTIETPVYPPPAFGAAGSEITDAIFGTRIIRVTDELTGSNNMPYGTPSGTYSNAWAADDSHFAITDRAGAALVYDFDPATGVFAFNHSFSAGQDPNFSRVITKPNIIYGPRYSNRLTFRQYDIDTQTWTDIFDCETDVPAVNKDSNDYCGAIYSSQASPEKLAMAFGGAELGVSGIQENWIYATVVEADSPTNRITLDVWRGLYKVNGGSWTQLLNADGTNWTGGVKLHNISIDRSGKWLFLGYGGAYGGASAGAFFNTSTRRIHAFDSDTFLGHYSEGWEQMVSMIADPTGGGVPQWLFKDLTQGAPFSTYRKLIDPNLSPSDHFHADHNSWNNARSDAQVPLISGVYQANGHGAWNVGHNEIIAISTAEGATQGTDQFWRACHHYCDGYPDPGVETWNWTFYDTPRPQVSHGGMWTLFSSNWGQTLGDTVAPYGYHSSYSGTTEYHRTDVFLVQMTNSPASEPSASPVIAMASTSLTYAAGSGAVVVDDSVVVADDDDDNLEGAVVEIDTNYNALFDSLGFVNQNGITGSWDSGTGILTLTGTATKAFYQTALRSITYTNSNPTPVSANRVVTMKVNDGDTDSNLASRTIVVQAAPITGSVTRSAFGRHPDSFLVERRS